MKIRDSAMPEREMWETFFKPKAVLATLGINKQIKDVVEFGCGYGTFTIPASQMIGGTVYALDIEPGMISVAADAAKKQGLNNVRTILRDFVTEGSGLPDESMAYAMLFNILHLEHPEVLIGEAKRVLKKNGKLGVIHWNYDPLTPRGPAMEIRPTQEDCWGWIENAGFHSLQRYDLRPYHYGIVAIK